MSLVARELESHGIATVIIGSALDIIEHAGVPRFLFVDFPLGNPCGKPYDRVMQQAIVQQGLALLQSARTPQTVENAPYQWSTDQGWRARYARVDEHNREQLMRQGDERRARQAGQKAAKERSPSGGG